MATSEGWDMPTGDLMKGKKGLIMGVANSSSIAWGIASQLAAQGAELAFTYLGEGLERRVRPLAESVGAKLLIQADVTDDASMDNAFAELEKEFGTIDFVVHSVAFANKDELKGSFVDNTTRDSFLLALNISAFSFVDVARRSAKLMPNGGSMITLTYLGSERVIPNYNTMGVAKAALEAATRYIARDLGPKNIRVNAISGGRHAHPVAGGNFWRTRAALQIGAVLADQGRDLDGGRRGRGPVALLGPGVVRPRAKSSTSMQASTPWACRKISRADPDGSVNNQGPPGDPAALFCFRGATAPLIRVAMSASNLPPPASFSAAAVAAVVGFGGTVALVGSGGSGAGRQPQPDRFDGDRPVPGHRPAGNGAELAVQDAGRSGLVDAGRGPAGGLDAGAGLVQRHRGLRVCGGPDGADGPSARAGAAGAEGSRLRSPRPCWRGCCCPSC